MKAILFILVSVMVSQAAQLRRDGTHCFCDSLAVMLHSNGSIASETPFIEGIRNGTQRIYYQTGELYASFPFKNGKLHGKYETFWKNGRYRVRRNYIDGVQVGIAAMFFENGKFAGSALYKDGMLVGTVNCSDGTHGDDNKLCIPESEEL